MRRANGGAVPARTQRSLKNRGPGRLGCGRPRLPRLHRDRGRPTTRGALRRVLTRRALGHWQTSPALASKPRGARYLDRGTTRWNSRAPARQGPSPEERHPVYPQRFNWFESTPKNAPRLPIQTNNHTTKVNNYRYVTCDVMCVTKINSHRKTHTTQEKFRKTKASVL